MHYSKGRRPQVAVQIQTVSIRSQQQNIEGLVKDLKHTVAQWTLIKASLIQLL